MTVISVRASSYNDNEIRKALSKGFELMGLPSENPFQKLIKPGDMVFIKPNWVAHQYRASCPYQYDLYTTITHPSIVREVARFVDRALEGQGQIIVGDNPSIDADFDVLIRRLRLESLQGELKSELVIRDLRPLVCTDLKHYGNKNRMSPRPGDPLGETVVNLGKNSLFQGVNPRLFRGVFTDRRETILAHSGDTHLYSFSNSIYKADVLISVPKLKTHHKAGVTLNLKGLVGAVSNKNWLVHWRNGFPAVGGDAYPSFWLWLMDKFKKTKKRGAWPGNDTIWRMVVDLYSAIRQRPRKYFSIVDGVLAGQGNGPFCPEPKESHVLILGDDLLETDIVATRLMGFDPRKIKYLQHLIEQEDIDLDAITFQSDVDEWKDIFHSNKDFLDFKAPLRWEFLKYD